MSKQPTVAAAELQQWAAEKLGLEPNASAEQVRRVFLRSLRDDAYVPPPQVQEALFVLQQDGKVERGQISEIPLFEIEDRLRNEIEVLSFEFFRLPIDERQQRLRQLSERCAWNAPLAAWLRRLRQAQFLDPHEIQASAPVRQLASTIADLYALPPTARVVQRIAWLRRLGKDRRGWRQSAQELQRAFPKIAALDSEVLEALTPTGSPPPAPLPARRPRAPAPLPKQPAPTGNKSWWFVWLAVVVIMAVLRATNTHRPAPLPRIQLQPPPAIKFEHPKFQPQLPPPQFPKVPDKRELPPRVREILEQMKQKK